MQKTAATRTLWPLAVLLCLVAFHYPSPGSGVNARLDIPFAIVDHGTLSIDALHVNTHDKTVFEGRFYSEKPPLPSVLGVPVLAALRLAERACGVSLSFRAAGYVVTTLTVTLAAFALALALRRYLGVFGDEPAATFAATVYVLGTPALVYAGLFFSHQFTAALLFFAFLCAFLRTRGETAGAGWSAVAGLFAGAAILSEYPAGLVTAWLLAYVAIGTRRATDIALFILTAFAVPAAAVGLNNWIAFGSPLHMAYGRPFLDYYAEPMNRGLFGITFPRPSALWLILFSPARGLFFLSPVLVLAVPGLVAMVRDAAWRREGVLFCAIAIGHLLFNAAYHQPGGGTSYGPRHLVPIVPFLIVPLAYWLARASAAWRKGALVLAALSVLITFASAAVEPLAPEQIANPLTEWVAVLAASGERTDNLLAAAVPGGWSVLVFAVVALGLFAWTGRGLVGSAPKAPRKRSAVPALAVCCLVALHASALNLVRTDEGVRAQAMGNHYSGREDWPRAIAWYERARGLRGDPYILYYLGRAYLGAGDVEGATRTYRKLLDAAPEMPEAARVRMILEAIADAQARVQPPEDAP